MGTQAKALAWKSARITFDKSILMFDKSSFDIYCLLSHSPNYIAHFNT